ncbi:1005_t:CDS:2 [Diversispora eburnea]|uniref:1005_t:CDS:1 n=1 Tax=Diversispora eburnea TaxID=1213867 RepID=A0A9N9ADJ7_9GLOM|nr:1005_t:CDS:2 [Diversispora eburnea]
MHRKNAVHSFFQRTQPPRGVKKVQSSLPDRNSSAPSTSSGSSIDVVNDPKPKTWKRMEIEKMPSKLKIKAQQKSKK